jgi:PAS domain S-box-containing protein
MSSRDPYPTSNQTSIPEAANTRAEVDAVRPETEAHLRRLHEMHELSESVARIGSWWLELASGRSEWSSGTFRLFGVDPEDFDGDFDRVIEERVHADDRAAVRAVRGAAVGGANPVTIEYRLSLPDGTPRILHSEGRLIRDDRGRPSAVIGYVQDVTERRQAEDQAALETQRLEAHMDNSPLAVVEFDPSFRITHWSEGATRLFGWAEDEVVGRRVVGDFRWVHEDDTEAVEQLAEAMAEGALPRSVGRNRNYRKDGSLIDCIWYNSCILHADGTLDSLLSQVLDITETARAEEEVRSLNADLEDRVWQRTRELNEAVERLRVSNEMLQAATSAKTRFLANMSHELRTPLNSIIGFTGVMLQGLSGPLEDEQLRQLAMVNASGQHLLALVDDILDLSRIEAGGAGLHLEDFSIGELVDEVVGSVRPLSDERELELTVRYSSRVGNMHSDRRCVRQILLNLMSNAVKFTTSGMVSISVHRRRGRVTFDVRDTGRGIAPEELGPIFEEFYQGPDPANGNVPGTGLGLAVSRRLAHALGGELTAQSEIGSGSTFTLSLPVAAS